MAGASYAPDTVIRNYGVTKYDKNANEENAVVLDGIVFVEVDSGSAPLSVGDSVYATSTGTATDGGTNVKGVCLESVDPTSYVGVTPYVKMLIVRG